MTTTILMSIHIQTCFDVDMTNANHPDEIVDIFDNNKHKDTLFYKSHSIICDELYNVMKK